jgi:hypothetical protein
MCIHWDGETDHNTCDPSATTSGYRVKIISFPWWYTEKIECNFTMRPHFWNTQPSSRLISNKTSFSALINLPKCSGIANKFPADFFTIQRCKFCAVCLNVNTLLTLIFSA